MNADEKLFIAKVWFMIISIVIAMLSLTVVFVHYLVSGG